MDDLVTLGHWHGDGRYFNVYVSAKAHDTIKKLLASPLVMYVIGFNADTTAGDVRGLVCHSHEDRGCGLPANLLHVFRGHNDYFTNYRDDPRELCGDFICFVASLVLQQNPGGLIHVCVGCDSLVIAEKMALKWIGHIQRPGDTTASNYRTGICGDCAQQMILFQLAHMRFDSPNYADEIGEEARNKRSLVPSCAESKRRRTGESDQNDDS